MSEPSKAAISKANELIRAVTPENVLSSAKINTATSYVDQAFALYIDKVSEVAKNTQQFIATSRYIRREERAAVLDELILPEPVDPLVEILSNGPDPEFTPLDDYAKYITRELAKRGGKIIWEDNR